MNIYDLPFDCICKIAAYNPISAIVSLSEADKKSSIFIAELIRNTSALLTEALQKIYEKSPLGETASLYLQKYSGKYMTTPYALSIDTRKEYKEEVLQEIAKRFTNLTYCSFIQKEEFEQSAHLCPEIERRVCHIASSALNICTLPFFLYNRVFESRQSNTIANDIEESFYFHSINMKSRKNYLGNYPLNSLSELFGSSLKELHLTVMANTLPIIGDWPMFCELPPFENIDKITIVGGIERGFDPTNLVNAMHARLFTAHILNFLNSPQAFSKYKNLTSLSIQELTLNGFRDSKSPSITQIITEHFPSTLKTLQIDNITLRTSTDPHSHEVVIPPNQVLTAILSHCTALKSLIMASDSYMRSLFTSIPNAPYTSLEKLEIKDQTEGGENLFQLFPNLSELVIHNWDDQASSITLVTVPQTLRKVLFRFRYGSHWYDKERIPRIKEKLVGKGFEIAFKEADLTSYLLT